MSLGKQIGEYALESKGITVIDETHMSENWEGTATLEGQEAHVLATVDVEGEPDNGDFMIQVAALFGDGHMMRNRAHGTYHATGVGQWATRSNSRLEDGRATAAEGNVDLKAHTWKGKIYEWN